jgi:4-hydroxy-tetrahydrodipicolinate synthase
MSYENTRLPDGVYAACLTPMKEDLSVDHAALAGHCRWLLDHGCHGLAVLGSTGEAQSLSIHERMEVLDGLQSADIPLERLMVGTGTCSVQETAALTRHAVHQGAGGVLVLPPFYYKRVKDGGMFAFFDQVIQTVGDDHLNIYLYHIPQVTGIGFSRELIQRLIHAYPEIIKGVKDSSGVWEHTRFLCETFPRLQVFAGTERLLLPLLRAGGAGCISATANVTCGLASKLFDHPGTPESETRQERLTALRKAFETFPLIPALKGFLAEQRGDVDWLNVRPPHTRLDPNERGRLFDAIKKSGGEEPPLL